VTRIVAVIGAVTPPGRLTAAVTAMLESARADGHGVTVIDLGSVKLDFADGRPASDHDDDSATVLAAIDAAECVLLATPVYRATLTGALKNLLDLVPVEGLRNKPVGILAMGATAHHFLGAESHLRDILAWFGAFTLPTAVYLQGSDFDSGQPVPAARERLEALTASAISAAEWSGRSGLGPTPLAGMRG